MARDGVLEEPRLPAMLLAVETRKHPSKKRSQAFYIVGIFKVLRFEVAHDVQGDEEATARSRISRKRGSLSGEKQIIRWHIDPSASVSLPNPIEVRSNLVHNDVFKLDRDFLCQNGKTLERHFGKLTKYKAFRFDLNQYPSPSCILQKQDVCASFLTHTGSYVRLIDKHHLTEVGGSTAASLEETCPQPLSKVARAKSADRGTSTPPMQPSDAQPATPERDAAAAAAHPDGAQAQEQEDVFLDAYQD